MLTCDKNHIYTDEQGSKVDNVTTILEVERYTDFSFVPNHIIEVSQEFGNHVHKACHLSDLGTLDYETLDPALLPYVEAWNKYLSDYKAEIVLCEHIVHSKIWGFCGTLDRVLRINGRLGIYDLKTGQGCSLQTAGYKIALEEQYPQYKIKDRAGIRLFGDGTYKVIPHNDKTEEGLFKSIVKTHNSRAKYNKGA